MKHIIARYISIIGHPLLSIPVFVTAVLFSNGDFKNSLLIFILIVGCIFVPLILRLYLKSRNGTYTNFDVSDRKQRKSIFVFIIPILIIVTLVLFKTQGYSNVFISMLFATVLVVAAQLINLFLKSSLHVSLNLYLSFLVLMVNVPVGMMLLLFTIALGWSRVVLKRHTLAEVLVGGILGLSVGLLMFYVEKGF